MKPIDLQEALYTKHPLKFDENGKFRILMISDIHGGVGYNAKQTIQAIQALVDEAKPDLVLLGGDIAGPGMIHIETAQQLREMLDGMELDLLGRYEFYDACCEKGVRLAISTGEKRVYANLLITIGVA